MKAPVPFKFSALEYRPAFSDRVERRRNRRAWIIRNAKRLVLVLLVFACALTTYYLIRTWYYSTHDISLAQARRDLVDLLEPMGKSVTLENAAIRIPDTYDDFPETRWYVLRVNDGDASRAFKELQERWRHLAGHSIWDSQLPDSPDYLAPQWWFLDRETATKASFMGISTASGGESNAVFEVFASDLWGRILVRRIGNSRD